ncbi:Cell wall integrity and stress response component 4 [Conoideocrella luteorostrata]|uniref:Cell wall integrity and stress response component 4 n=1 Tax=Conoideocrella luteorostrata TaxID=1105319 RepID=A0AAJ0CZ99_9HYPO|nr:Cell wall integrity and stress response component 4 [Conoideocrella luteorostrata]
MTFAMSPSCLMTGQGLSSLMAIASIWTGLANAFDAKICASFNTASSDRNVSMYQTNGLCHDFCAPGGFAYAITQSNSCWCSSFTPDGSTQVSTSRCNSNCPGYPQEKCGGPGLYAYIVLDGALPSGTKGGSTPPSSVPSSIPSTTSQAETETETTATTTKTKTPKPATTSIETVTADGTVKTVTIIPTVTGHASGDNQGITVQESGLKTGAIVGIVVGVVGGVLALAAFIMFCYFRRKKQQQQEDYQDDPSIRGSSSGMMGSGRAEMSRAPGSPGSTGNRSSTLPVDPRMNPFQQSLYARNGSRESIGTLRDDHDYSRRIQQPKVLRATNPDPDVG